MNWEFVIHCVTAKQFCSNVQDDDTPFDITGYKYLTYDIADPSKTLDELKLTIKETIEMNRPDSPVFKMLSEIRIAGYRKIFSATRGFHGGIKLACDSKQVGKLSLLAAEAESFEWRVPALRLIGEGLYKLKATDTSGIMVWKGSKIDPEAGSRTIVLLPFNNG